MRLLSKPLRALAAVVVLFLGFLPRAQTQQANTNSALGRQEYFFHQRLFGLNYIPENALANAVAQRDSALSFAASSFAAPALSAQLRLAADARWTSFGPAGMVSTRNDLVSGRVNSLAVDPRNPATIYLAAAGGGVWKSTNRGDHWVPLTDQLPSLASGAVAVDPFSGDVWYGTGELNFCRDCYYGAGVYRSSDGGVSWTRINPGNFLASETSLIAFDPNRPGTLFIGRSTALWRSADGGVNWEVVLRGTITDFVLHPANSSIAYAAVGHFSGSPENGVYRTTDGGLTWTRLANGFPEQSTIGRVAIALAESSPNTLYSLIANAADFKLNGLYRSLNAGSTWSRLGSLPQDVLTEAGAGQGAFNLCLAVDPGDPGVIYAGGVSLWKSFDFGSNWQNLTLAAALSEDPHEIIFDLSDRRTLYLLGDSGVWRSRDGGRTFANSNLSLAITQFQGVGLHPTNPNRAVGGTQDNGTALYNGGAIWDQGRPGDSGASFFDVADPQILYTVARRLDVRRSDDGGRTFQPISTGLDPADRVLFYPPLISHPTRPGVLYLGTHRLWESRDRGERWLPVSGDLTEGAGTISALAVSPVSPETLFAGTSDGLVQVSHDSGRTWSRIDNPDFPDRYVTSIAPDPGNSQRLTVGVSGFNTGHVFRTVDLGLSWEDISGNLPDIPVNAVLVDGLSPQTIYLGTDIGVFVFLEDGNWAPMQNGLPNAVVLGLAQNTSTGLLVAATHGRGAFAIATGEPASSVPRFGSAANAASFATVPLAPGMVASLFGANLAPETATASAIPLPTTLGGASLFVNDTAVPLFYASPSQVNFQVPLGLGGPYLEMRLANSRGEAIMRVPRRDFSPGIYNSDGLGIILHGSGAFVSDSAPAMRGEELAMFASGLGAVNPVITSGDPALSSPLSLTPSFPVVRVGGVVAATRFSGLTPGFVGLYQVNFAVPEGVSGTVPISIELNGIRSNTVLITVEP
jgi:uncharacterized protein (TIGR03437 family)